MAREKEMEDAAEDVAVTPSPSASSWTELPSDVDEVGAVFYYHFDLYDLDSNGQICLKKKVLKITDARDGRCVMGERRLRGAVG